MTTKFLILFTSVMTLGTTAFASFLPPDFIPRRMSYAEQAPNDMTEQEFNDIIAKVEDFYQPIVSSHGVKLKVVRNWSDDTINAFARQLFNTWEVQMFGGLARYHLMTNDGFAMVMCHELGHHIGGFPIKPGFFGLQEWAANEGQSDYFAAHVCAPKIWEDEIETNASFREDVDPLVQEKCDSVYEEEARQNICYRVVAGGLSLSRTLADLSETPQPNYATPNPDVVSSTYHAHPEAQCRLDTTFAAALCDAEFDDMFIPGKDTEGGVKSPEAEREAADNSCMRIDDYENGVRPVCWFKPAL